MERSILTYCVEVLNGLLASLKGYQGAVESLVHSVRQGEERDTLRTKRSIEQEALKNVTSYYRVWNALKRDYPEVNNVLHDESSDVYKLFTEVERVRQLCIEDTDKTAHALSSKMDQLKTQLEKIRVPGSPNGPYAKTNENATFIDIRT